MLSQRLAKAALMSVLLKGKAGAAAADSMAAAIAEIVEGFAYLGHLPLSNAEIGVALAEAAQAWAGFQAVLMQPDTDAGKDGVAALSEALLAQFDRLTDHLERGMQALIR